MKLALFVILFVPVFATAANSAPVQPEPAKVVSELILGRQSILTYYNETTEQVCTYSEARSHAPPSLACVSLYALSRDAQEKVRRLANVP